MKLLKTSILFASIALSASAFTVNLALDGLTNADGTTFSATSTLAMVVVDSSGNGFSAQNAGSFAVGAAINGTDDYVAWKGDLSANAQDGTFFQSVSFDIGTLEVPFNSQFAFVWMPNLTNASTSFTAGQSYGMYTTTALSFESTTGWVVGANNGASININAWTKNNTGTLASTPDSSGLANSALSANLTVSAIPEPATYAAHFGLGVLGLAAFRRRRTAV